MGNVEHMSIYHGQMSGNVLGLLFDDETPSLTSVMRTRVRDVVQIYST